MGRSVTYHCLGYTEAENERRFVYPAMSRLEVHQAIKKAERDGKELIIWEAQTRIGVKILKGRFVSSPQLPPPPSGYSKCVVCSEGRGCPVCNWSGWTVRGNERGWAEWQLENMRRKYGNNTR